MKKVKHRAKQTFALLLGIPVLVLGIILIPVPGPGVLVTLLGLYILSFGFESMKKHRDHYVTKLKDIYKKAKDKQQKFLDKYNS